jgi:hypothetical protein
MGDLTHSAASGQGQFPPCRRGAPSQEAPYCWQSKLALKKIRECFDSAHTVQSAIAVYIALTEIASDSASSEFTTTHAWIAQRSGASVRTVTSRLRDLVEIGLVKIETPALKAPSNYTVMSVLQPLQNDLQRTKSRSLPTSEEPKKKILNKRRKKDFANALNPVP